MSKKLYEKEIRSAFEDLKVCNYLDIKNSLKALSEYEENLKHLLSTLSEDEYEKIKKNILIFEESFKTEDVNNRLLNYTTSYIHTTLTTVVIFIATGLIDPIKNNGNILNAFNEYKGLLFIVGVFIIFLNISILLINGLIVKLLSLCFLKHKMKIKSTIEIIKNYKIYK